MEESTFPQQRGNAAPSFVKESQQYRVAVCGKTHQKDRKWPLKCFIVNSGLLSFACGISLDPVILFSFCVLHLFSHEPKLLLFNGSQRVAKNLH